MPLPKGVTRVRGKNGVDYWYHQERRGKENAGPRTRLPEFGTPEFYAALAKITGEAPTTGETINALIDAYKLQPEWQKLRPNSVAAYGRALAHIADAWGGWTRLLSPQPTSWECGPRSPTGLLWEISFSLKSGRS